MQQQTELSIFEKVKQTRKVLQKADILDLVIKEDHKTVTEYTHLKVVAERVRKESNKSLKDLHECIKDYIYVDFEKTKDARSFLKGRSSNGLFGTEDTLLNRFAWAIVDVLSGKCKKISESTDSEMDAVFIGQGELIEFGLNTLVSFEYHQLLDRTPSRKLIIELQQFAEL